MRKFLKIIVVIAVVGLAGFVGYLLKTTPVAYYYLNRNKVAVAEDIAYVKDSRNIRHKLDIYVPKDKRDFPVVHFLYGGYWRSGDKQYIQPLTGLYANIGIALARQGIGVVIQDYRLIPDVTIDQQIGDVADGIAWTQQHIKEYGGNGEIFLMGHSAGGHLASLVGTDQHYLKQRQVDMRNIKGVIDLSSILDVADMVAQNDDTFNQEISYRTFGTSAENFKKYSPITYFQSSQMPFLIMVGEHDYGYIKRQLDQIVGRLVRTPKAPLYEVIPGFEHQDMVVHFDQIMTPIVEFVNN